MPQECHCIIRHANTRAERVAVRKALRLARKQGDSTGIVLAMAQLTGKCPAKKVVQ